MAKKYKTINALMTAKLMGKVTEEEFNKQLDEITNKQIYF